jgi:general secretion pathway protein D
MMTLHSRGARLAFLVLVTALMAGCASSGRAYGRGNRAAQMGDWDTAVEYFRQAVQREPNRADYNIALERAMLSASRVHLDQARVFEARNQLEDALREYRRASEFDPPNRQVAAKALEIERLIRDQAEAAAPRTTIAQMRAQARQATNQPVLIAANERVSGVRFNNTSLRDALNVIGMATGINVTYESTYQDRPITVQLDNVTLEQALQQLLSSNQMFYKVVNAQTILVIPDNNNNRLRYEEQVIRTFFISHADATELAQLINGIIRVPNMAVQPQVQPNKTANTITVRATTPIADIIEKIIDANDNPRAEVVIDVQILEVNRIRTKRFGLDLGNYQVAGVFSPEASGIGDSGALSGQPFNANTITRGISTADFYLAVPSAIIRFLETDSETKLIAKPQLRGSEGQKITMNLGDEIPVPATVFTPIAQGGANTNPLTSFNYKTVGVVVEMTPRVTPEGDVILDLSVENSTRGGDVNIAGQNLPSFGTRKVITRLRLRDGESNLLAGLLRETDRKQLRGVPGLLRLPVLSKLLADNDTQIDQTDIVMLLTPRIVRTQELTMQDVSPIFIGAGGNLSLGGPPPLIAPVEPDPAAPAVAPAGALPVGPGVPVIPPGSSQIPGTTTAPAAPTPGTPAPPNVQPQPSPVTPVAPAPVGPQGAAPPVATPGVTPTNTGGAQLVVTPPGTDFRVGGGPYTVAISATNAARLSAVSVTLTFNPAAVRVRTVQEGSFMRSGGANAVFSQQVDASTGRIDIAIVRPGDSTGVAGTGLLAAVLFDAIGGGAVNLSITGTASAPGGTTLPVQIAAVPAVTVR